MLKSTLKASVYIACLAWSSFACAAGLGGINVTSSLGQPLKAEIEVVSVDKADKGSLRAKLASADAYKNAGVDYPYSIPKIKFQLEERADGEQYIKVTTAQPVNDPFVTLMVELSWSSGKLLREYTFLLDPPDYKAEQPKAEEVKPIEPVLAAPVVAPVETPLAASEPVAAEPVPEKPTAAEAFPAVVPVGESAVAATPTAEAAPAETTQQALNQASAPVAAAPVEPGQVETSPVKQDALAKEEALAEAAPAPTTEQITVVRGDTLTKIAAQIKPENVSLERMLVALYRENAGVFDAHNMNRIRAGRILKIPSGEATQMLPQADAEEEIRVQAADWNAYRQKLAAARAPTAERADKQEAAGKISTAVTDRASASKEPAKEVLKLSKGEAPSDKTVGGGKSTAQEKEIAKEEEAIATSKALKEAEERTAILEKNVQDMKRLAELKKESAAPAPAPAPAVGAVTMNAASAPQPASSVAPAKPKAKFVPPKVVEEPSLIDQLLGEPLYLAGGAALLLALGGLGFMVARRGKRGGSKKKAEDIGSTTGHIAAPVAPSPETGDFTRSHAQAAPAAKVDTEEVDPIGEADLFLTFGRDAQAEEVLKEALKKNPNNIPVKLKLLSIYSNRKDTNSFYSYAREIKESGDESAWKQTADMGREVDPSNPFYGGGSTAAPAVAGKAGTAAAPAVDFDLGFGSPAPAKPVFTSQNTVVLEEPKSLEKTSIISPQEMQSATQAATMDFDITGTNPGMPSMPSGGNQDATLALNVDDLVFDVTATHPRVPVSAAPAAAEPAGDGGLTFTLDFPTETQAKPAVSTPNLGLDEITLNLDKPVSSTGAGAGGPKDERWQEVATKLDLAKAYQEMGDAAGAREILEEVMRDGDEQQRGTAQSLMQQL